MSKSATSTTIDIRAKRRFRNRFGLPLRLQVYANRNLVDLDVARRDLGILLGEWDILKLSESGTEHFTVSIFQNYIRI